MIELLAVIGIIGLMLLLIGLPFGGGRSTVSLAASQQMAAELFQRARSIAALRQRTTLVIIHADHAADPSKFLRYLGIVILKDGVPLDAAGPSDWIPASTGIYFPRGVYYIPEEVSGLPGFSEVLDRAVPLLESEPNYVGRLEGHTVRVEFPVMGGEGSVFYFYQFDEQGLSENPGGSFVMSVGEVGYSALEGVETVRVSNPYAVAGLVIRQLGGVTELNDYTEITQRGSQ